MARRPFRPSIIVTVASTALVGCPSSSSSGGGGTRPRTGGSPASVFETSGRCRLMPASRGCPEGASCNPPPPMPIDCPPDRRATGWESLPEARLVDDARPPGKGGWLRAHQQFSHYRGTCSYSSDELCPPPGTPGQCFGQHHQEVPCRVVPTAPAGSLSASAAPGQAAAPRQGVPSAAASASAAPSASATPPAPAAPGDIVVPSFTAPRAAGGCVVYPTFYCRKQSNGYHQCVLPAPKPVACP